VTDRATLLRLLYDHNVAKYGVPFEDWERATTGWHLEPIEQGGQVIAAVMILMNELHIAACAKPKGSTRAAVRNILLPVVQEWGSAKTRVMADNRAGIRFCQRLGFEIESEENGIVSLTCKRPAHA
jgi:GNAT superfamily N-acetyltransferase